jgi:hypothetical protein
MKIILSLVLFISTGSFAQSADFIILKKNNKTIQTFYSGSDIAFTSTRGAFVHAQINAIKNDTLYLQEFVVRMLPTTFGTYVFDTAGSYHYKYHYKEIKVIGRKEKTNFDMRGSGAALLGGGILLTLASGVVYLADPKKFSAPLLIAAVGLGTAGYFMSKGKSGGMIIGKKYQMLYMDMSDKKR